MTGMRRPIERSEQADTAYRQMAEWRVVHRDEREDVEDVPTARGGG